MRFLMLPIVIITELFKLPLTIWRISQNIRDKWACDRALDAILEKDTLENIDTTQDFQLCLNKMNLINIPREDGDFQITLALYLRAIKEKYPNKQIRLTCDHRPFDNLKKNVIAYLIQVGDITLDKHTKARLNQYDDSILSAPMSISM